MPIQRKLRLVVLATCTAALCVASSALFAFQFYRFKVNFERDLTSVAAIIASNSTAAVQFRNEDDSREILAALKAKPQIVGSEIILADGNSLAVLGETHRYHDRDKLPRPGFRNDGRDLLYVHPIILDNERIGTLLLHAAYAREAAQLYRLYALTIIAVLCISFLVAILVASKLERVILGPIKALADTAHHVTTKHDYSVRAPKVVNDEVGMFTDSFNSMLDQIQARDTALLHEIAERKRAEQELQSAQQQLMDASRQAGMAEVATGVLHNVGNVLNSVNVSATLISERLGQSKTENLVRATALMRAQNGNLSEFFTNDPKGKLLPNYLADLSEHLDGERRSACTELELLTKNIEHIKDIVAMQQTYARVSGVVEHLPIQALIEDSIGLNVDSLKRHGVTVVREYAPVPLVAVDKHKVLQILINIIRNATLAMDEGGSGEKRLTVSIGAKDPKTVVVSLRDTGVGIAPENLTRIFSHGFTTRQNGHGFGLHSAGLAAQQMGGRLLAQSDGPGLGATFLFELPIAAAPKS
jgi:C4-dicarboxylate-specific signal transduction histidine kinase